MKKKFLSLLIAGLMIISLIPSAFADSYIRIGSKSDPRIDEMLNAIDSQNFDDSGTNAKKAKKMIKHVIFDASFAAIDGGSFNYPNSGGYVSVIDDGTYSVGIRGAKGCFAYANYVTNLVYGEELGTAGLNNIVGRQVHTPDTLKNLLVTQAQAGEHIRIGDVHSVAFVSADEDGFYCLSYQNMNATNNIELQYWTYEEFLNYSYYSGYEVYLFNANTAINREVSNLYAPNEHMQPFTDVPEDSEYYDAVIWIFDKGITTGYTSTEFNIDGRCTRAQAVTFLWRAAGCPTGIFMQNSFSDVSRDAYYHDAIVWASSQGICKGFSDGCFHPDDTVTRAQFITLLWRANNEPEPINPVNMYSDIYLGQYFYKAVLWGSERNIIKGNGEGQFMPDNPCTRGQIALFMYRDMSKTVA